jgi:hypothetical protein
LIEHASSRLGEGWWDNDADSTLPPRTVLAQVVCTGSVNDRSTMCIQTQAVTEPAGPLSGILEVLREGHGLCIADGSTISLGVLRCTLRPQACYQDTALRRSACSDELPSFAQQHACGGLTCGAELFRVFGGPRGRCLGIAVTLGIDSYPPLAHPESPAGCPGLGNRTIGHVDHGFVGVGVNEVMLVPTGGTRKGDLCPCDQTVEIGFVVGQRSDALRSGITAAREDQNAVYLLLGCAKALQQTNGINQCAARGLPGR